MTEEEMFKIMARAEVNDKRVKVITNDGIEHIGTVDAFCSRYDNDDGRAGICFDGDNGEAPYITEDEITSIEFVQPIPYSEKQISKLRALLEKVPDGYPEFVEKQIAASRHNGTVKQLIEHLEWKPDTNTSDIARFFS